MADTEVSTKKITIDDREYDNDQLSDEARAQVVSISVVDQEIAALEQKLAIAKTARNAYGKALKDALGEDQFL